MNFKFLICNIQYPVKIQLFEIGNYLKLVII